MGKYGERGNKLQLEPEEERLPSHNALKYQVYYHIVRDVISSSQLSSVLDQDDWKLRKIWETGRFG